MAPVTAASGIGLATLAANGSVLDTWFPAPELIGSGESGTVRLSVAEVPDEFAALAGRDDERDTETVVVRTVIGSLDDKAADAYDAYLRLHLLSHRLVAPHGLNADGLFGVLTNVVWTNHGPCSVEGFEIVRGLCDGRGQVQEDRVPRLHVGGAAAVQRVAVSATGQVAGRRDGVEVPGQQHPRRAAQRSAGQHRVAVADDLVPQRLGSLRPQRGLDLVGDTFFVP